MKNFCARVSCALTPLLMLGMHLFAQTTPVITGPNIDGIPLTLGPGITPDQVYSTEPGNSNYQWSVSSAGVITAGSGTNSITVTWTDPHGQQSVSVKYIDINGPSNTAVLIINYYPFAPPLDPTTIPQFVDPLPHFAAGLRVNAKSGGRLVVKTTLVQQIALSTGTVLQTGTIGDPLTPQAGKGKYAAYAISTDDGVTFGPAMWPAQTIESRQGFPLTVQYRNELAGVRYSDFNILADQTLMMNGYVLNGNPITDPYMGDIPMVVHLHGGEVPSASDGGPNSWFTPGYALLGPAFRYNASSQTSYPNQQEATTLWFHPHDDGLTRINVYTGLAGFYFLRGEDEEAAHLPGWSGDDLVKEVTPAGKTQTFNSSAYLPEIELAIQDRMFNVNGELYWPVEPPNPEIHPFWTPEFDGNVIVVNGKSWPYLSVAPRKYRFRVLDGCNARFLNMWLENSADGTSGPEITVIGGDGGLLADPKVLDPEAGETLLMAPGQRYDLVIDFSDIPEGTTFTLINNANMPYPFGDPVIPGITDHIMQFVVNGEMIAANPPDPPIDKSTVPADLRPVTPLVKLTDFNGSLSDGVTPVVKRHLILNEVMGPGGPASVLINNYFFESVLSFATDPVYKAGGPTEFLHEGTTEEISIINISADAHPIHIHLLQWQLVGRRPIDPDAYMIAYMQAWEPRGIPEFPAGLGYPGGAGTPFPYETVNADGAIGGNPAISPFFTGPVIPANPEEEGWKDDVIVLPGEMTTFVVRVAPTDRPVNTPQENLLLPFDPSLGPGYVWHCHIIDHEDMSMMRPLMILPSQLRYPQITAQPSNLTVCLGDLIRFSVGATSATTIRYQWQLSTDDGGNWTNLANVSPYSGVTASILKVKPSLSLTGNLYRCVLTNIDGSVTSTSAELTVNDCFISGTLKYNNDSKDPLAGFTIKIKGQTAVTDEDGAFIIPNIISGNHVVNITPAPGCEPCSFNASDAGSLRYWVAYPSAIPNAQFLAGDVKIDKTLANTDADAIELHYLIERPFSIPWVFWNKTGSGTSCPPVYKVAVNGSSVTGLNILVMCSGDFNGSYSPDGPASPVILWTDGPTVQVPGGKAFDLPITSVQSLQVSAISLRLNIPSELVYIKKVSVPGNSGSLRYWKEEPGKLTIAWSAVNPLNIAPGGTLVNLTLVPAPAFIPGQVLTIGLDSDDRNELGDSNYEPLTAELTASSVAITTAESLLIRAFPNPASSATTIAYDLPFDGKVTIGFYNGSGVLVLQTQVNNEFRATGSYGFQQDVGSLIKGSYYLKMRVIKGTKTYSASVKFIRE